MSFRSLLVMLAVLVGCSRQPPEGVYPCTHPGVHVGAPECPADWYCRLDNHCWSAADPQRDGGADDGSTSDAGSGDAAIADVGATDVALDTGRDSGSVCTPTTPSTEVCDGLDNDCNGTPDDATSTTLCSMGETCLTGRCVPRHHWSAGFGSVDTALYHQAVLDDAHNLYVVGQLQHAFNFGTGTLTPMGADILVLSFDPDGNVRWAREFGGTGSDFGLAIAVRGGQVVVAGAFRGTVAFPGASVTSTGTIDVAIFALEAATGADRWTRPVHTSFSGGASLAISNAGLVIAAVSAQGTADLGGGPRGVTGSPAVVLAGVTSAGGHQWSRAVVGATNPLLALDGLGPVVVVDAGATSIDFGDGTALSGGRVGVMRFDATTGAYARAARHAADSNTYAISFVDSMLGMCFSGTETASDFGTSAGAGTGFVACVDRGTLAVTNAVALAHTRLLLCPSDDGGLYVAGSNEDTTTPLMLGSVTVPAGAAFVAQADPLGSYRWVRAFGASTVLSGEIRTHVLGVAATAPPTNWGGGTRTGSLQLAVYDL
jgi:hypothetical protein